MKQAQRIASVLLFLVITLHCSHALPEVPNVFGMEISDMFDPYKTELASQWVLSGHNPSQNRTFDCSGNMILGGPGLITSSGGYFERTYTNLPAHDMISYSLTLMIGDIWTSSNNFAVKFDSQTFIYSPTINLASKGQNKCGQSGGEILEYVQGVVFHTGSTLTLRITPNVDPTKGWLGIDGMKLMMSTQQAGESAFNCEIAGWPPASAMNFTCGCSRTNSGWLSRSGSGCISGCGSNCVFCYGSAAKQCLSCSGGYIWDGTKCTSISVPSGCLYYDPLNSNKCVLCQSGKFLSYDRTCLTTCNAPNVQEINGGYKTCKTLCQATNAFLLWDNTNCNSTCAAPLKTRLVGDAKFCDYPCTSSQFLYSNGSCLTTCVSPFAQKTKYGSKFCEAPCAAGEYLFANGSCLTSCSSPYVVKVVSGINLCDTGCSAGQYLYPNGSCLATCTSPLTPTVVGGANICEFTCSTGQYLHSNGTCLNSCDSPLIKKMMYGVNFCNSPCNTSNGEYLYSNGSCLTTCPSPFSQNMRNGVNVCDFPCTNAQFLYPNNSCMATCDWPNTQAEYKTCDCPRYTTNTNGNCVPCTLAGCSKCNKNVAWCDVCLDGCASCDLSDLSCSKCSDPSYFIYNGKCINSCPATSSSCEQMSASGCSKCSCGYGKINETTCYPQCKEIEMNTMAQMCQNMSTTYQSPACFENLQYGIFSTDCLVSPGKKLTYQLTYDPNLNYFNQSQNASVMACGSGSQKSLPMKYKGSTFGAFVMMMRAAGLKTISGNNLSSPDAINKKLAPLVTKDDCNFDYYASLLQSSEFPFSYLGRFGLWKPNSDFSKMPFADLKQIYDKGSFEKVFGTLASCGNKCSSILVWRKKASSPGSSIVKSAALLVKFETSTTTGTVEELYTNMKISFADPLGTDSSSKLRTKEKLCFEETEQGVLTRSCLDEVYIFKR